MPFEYFFPKTFYYSDQLIAENENAALKEAAYALQREFPESPREHIYTSYGSLANVISRPAFAVLKDKIIAEVVAYLDRIDTREGLACEISDSWISISSPGNYERMHTHDGAYVSGVYYIQTPPGCGNICFENMDDNMWASRREKRENFNAVRYEPRERRVVLFNSRVPHHVEQNRSAGDRIILSFNVALG